MSTVPDEFARFQRVSRNYSDVGTYVPNKFSETFSRFPYLILTELRNPSQETIDAMVNTPWPEGMSGADQVKAMLNAAIDTIIGPKE